MIDDDDLIAGTALVPPSGRFEINWIDRNREPQCPPNPDYPDGVDLDISDGKMACETSLPYPAARCGIYTVRCKLCGYSVGLTTAGRPDDPRSIKVPCNPMSRA